MEAPTIGGVRVRKGDGETVRLPRGASLTDFAERIGVDAAQLVQMLFSLGEMVTATESVNDATLELLGEELNYVVEVVSPEDEDRELLESFDLEFGEDEGDESDLVIRPPVVTVMGHVDHGKTKLLDALRNANVVDKEAGGITQHIGAYQVAAEVDGNERRITFIDTPGHEAFTAMRARGAQATDIAILVVAADDGVMPQTVEALNHAKAAGVPIVVAVNKIDKPDADPTKVRGQLTEYGLVPEEYGGDAMFVDVSAKSELNLDKLLEAVVLTADASLDLRANPNQDAQGLVVEAHLDRGRGPVATVLVQRGTLRVGDSIVAGAGYGRVRAMLDEHGDNIEEADPSRPAMVLGLTAVPGAGQTFIVVEDDRMARQIAEKRESRERAAMQAKRRVRRTLEDFMASMEKGASQELNLILKGDVSGSVEALEDALLADRRRRRGQPPGHRPRCRCDHRDQRRPGRGLRRHHHRLQRPAPGQGDRDGGQGRCRDPLLLGHLPGDRRDRGGAQGPAQAGLRGVDPRPGGDPRDLPLVQDRQHRGLHGHQRRHPPQRQGPGAPRQRGRRRQPRPGLAQAGEGRRVRGPRGLRVRSGAAQLPGHQERRHRRVLRDARDPARLMRRAREPAVNSAPQKLTSGGSSASDELGERREHMASPRVRKIADRIQVIVAEMLERRIKDPRLGFVTITDVRLTGDSQQATIFYTVLAGAAGEQSDEAALADTAAALESAKGLIRSEVAKQLGMRITPSLTFVADALPESARHLDEVLARARALDEEVAARRVERTPASRTRTRSRARSSTRTTTPTRTPTTLDEDADELTAESGLVVVDKPAGIDLARRGRPGPPARRHPQGRPRRHPRPDGDRRPGRRASSGPPGCSAT